MEEVNDFINNLAIAYDKEALKEETRRINAVVTAEEFRFYFGNMKESTKLSPLGRHIDHYKAMLDNDNLVDLIVAMLNIGLSTGVALDRWKHTISVMLEKTKAAPSCTDYVLYNYSRQTIIFYWRSSRAPTHAIHTRTLQCQ